MPVAGNKALGPLKLSIQPGKGSLHEAPTIEGLTIVHGRSLHSCTIRDSANALVNVYVLGFNLITFGVIKLTISSSIHSTASINFSGFTGGL